MPTTAQATTWAESYRQAWLTADASALSALFSPDGEYRDNIFEAPHVGTEAIEAYWNGVCAAQQDVRVQMGVPVVDGDRVVVEFWTNMVVGDPVTLPGSLILDFNEAGLCTKLREYWHWQPGTFDPPSGWGQ